MNENDFDLAARAWLEDGPSRMSDHGVRSTLEEIHATRQRRATWPAWRATSISFIAGLAGAAVLVIAVGFLALTVAQRQPDRSRVGGPPTASSSADPTRGPSPSPTQPLDVPPLTMTFVSPRNGFSMKLPDRVALTPAKQLWGFSRQPDDGFDVVETGLNAVFKGASMPGLDATNVENGFVIGSDGVSVDAWIDEQIADYGGCRVPRTQQAELTIDGQSGRISACANRVEATVVAGGRLYLFTLSHDRPDARALFDAFAATIDLTPGTAVDVPSLTSTFVSAANGYSFGYLDRGEGTLAPAKEPWDPVNQPPIHDLGSSGAQYLRQFDVVETALGAVFLSASTRIPDGLATDRWVDAAVVKYLPSGCYVPRSQQAEITIDGQSGRISACAHEVEATVVAGGRLYLFILTHGRTDARAFFDAFVDTIHLRPGDAAAPSSMPPA